MVNFEVQVTHFPNEKGIGCVKKRRCLEVKVEMLHLGMIDNKKGKSVGVKIKKETVTELYECKLLSSHLIHI